MTPLQTAVAEWCASDTAKIERVSLLKLLQESRGRGLEESDTLVDIKITVLPLPPKLPKGIWR